MDFTNFSGVWDKDSAASDCMMEAATLMQLGTLMRQAVRLIRGIEITHHTAVSFEMAVFSVLPWFKVWEKYKIDGSCCANSRRDFRKGGMTGHAAVDEAGDKLMLKLVFDDPFGGSAVDVFQMPHPDTLHVDSTITTAKGSVSYRSVFHRRGSRATQLAGGAAGEAAHAE